MSKPLQNLRLFSGFLRSLARNIGHYYLSATSSHPNQEIQKICENLDRDGIVTIPHFLTADQCTQLRNEIDRLFAIHSPKLWRDPLGSDERFFGIETKSGLINELFFSSNLINQVLDFYEKSTTKAMFTMAGRIRFKENNLGSGQGWHRDRADYKQTKAILYLVDTDKTNGPFQYIYRSHRPGHLLSDYMKYKIDPMDSRIPDEKVERLIAHEPDRLKTFTAPAGTLLLADVRGMHRGSPLLQGERYALTNYNWYDSETPEHIAKLIIK